MRHLDLSDNRGVRGLCPTLHSLNLSRNGLTDPFPGVLSATELRKLDLSHNKIGVESFKEWLKVQYLGQLRELVLDKVPLQG